MTTNTLTNTNTQVEAGYEASRFALATGMAMAALVGLWGTACLASALLQNGPLGLLKSYFAAVLG